ncbi:hypothetical protein L6164_021013 [Bauhinia variegata]|uniref:Uncharacterized protein n=1 Tax=Bauhinia variegata TaxID=167791 RepID=A0ACB9MWU0_BAUVA|nr:hypothetical protein L6164_021013 [Bauhinia variegata]
MLAMYVCMLTRHIAYIGGNARWACYLDGQACWLCTLPMWVGMQAGSVAYASGHYAYAGGMLLVLVGLQASTLLVYEEMLVEHTTCAGGHVDYAHCLCGHTAYISGNSKFAHCLYGLACLMGTLLVVMGVLAGHIAYAGGNGSWKHSLCEIVSWQAAYAGGMLVGHVSCVGGHSTYLDGMLVGHDACAGRVRMLVQHATCVDTLLVQVGIWLVWERLLTGTLPLLESMLARHIACVSGHATLRVGLLAMHAANVSGLACVGTLPSQVGMLAKHATCAGGLVGKHDAYAGMPTRMLPMQVGILVGHAASIGECATSAGGKARFAHCLYKWASWLGTLLVRMSMLVAMLDEDVAYVSVNARFACCLYGSTCWMGTLPMQMNMLAKHDAYARGVASCHVVCAGGFATYHITHVGGLLARHAGWAHSLCRYEC